MPIQRSRFGILLIFVAVHVKTQVHVQKMPTYFFLKNVYAFRYHMTNRFFCVIGLLPLKNPDFTLKETPINMMILGYQMVFNTSKFKARSGFECLT